MLLAIASIWLELVICGVLFCALILCAANEGVEFGIFLIVIAAVLHDWMSPPERDVWRFIAANWLYCLGGIVAYMPSGCGWSLFRWRQLVFAQKREYDAQMKVAQPWQNETVERMRERLLAHYRPDAGQHKRQLIAWIVYWPFDLTWYALHDSLTAFVNAVYRRMAAVYTRIVERAFDG